MAGPTIRVATRQDEPRLIDILCRAFDRELFVDWFVRHDARRAEGFRRFFAANLRLSMPYGHVYVTEDYSGTAVWTPPGRWRAAWRQQARLVPEIMRVTGLWRCVPRLLSVERGEQFHPAAPH